MDDDVVIGTQTPEPQAATGDSAPPATPSATPSTDGPAVSQPGSAPGSTGGPSVEPQGSQKMLSELINARRRAQESEALLRVFMEKQGGGQPPQTQQPTQAPSPIQLGDPPVAPDPSQYGDDWDGLHRAELKYAADLGRYNALHDIQSLLPRHVDGVVAAQREREREVSAMQNFQRQVSEAAKADPDIMLLATDPTLPWSDTMLRVMRGSQNGARLLKYYGSNPMEISRVAAMDVISAAAEMGRIEATLAVADHPAPVQRISQAPTPITPVSQQSASAITTDPEEAATMDEYYARMNAVDPYTTGKR